MGMVAFRRLLSSENWPFIISEYISLTASLPKLVRLLHCHMGDLQYRHDLSGASREVVSRNMSHAESTSSSDDLPDEHPRVICRQLAWPRAIDFLIALLLTASAGLKAFSPADAISTAASLSAGHWAVVVLVQIELLIAMWLLTGCKLWWARWTGASLFLVFSAISFTLLLQGHGSCGCFGSVRLHPGIMIGIDVVAILAIVLAIRTPSPPSTRSRLTTLAPWAIGALMPALLATTVINSPSTMAGDTLIDDSVGLVILEPDTWIGKPFPLEPHLVPSVHLSDGEVVLVVYHHDCPDCQKAIPRYLAAAEASPSPNRRFVLAEVPPVGDETHYSSLLHTSLSQDREWFVEAPVELLIKEGIVISVRRELDSHEIGADFVD
jgi:hypothetical protein